MLVTPAGTSNVCSSSLDSNSTVVAKAGAAAVNAHAVAHSTAILKSRLR
jgi:hypothetical protein